MKVIEIKESVKEAHEAIIDILTGRNTKTPRYTAAKWFRMTYPERPNVYRGVSDLSGLDYKMVWPRTDRRPRDSTMAQHRFFKEIINRAGKVANRDNSFFVTNRLYEAEEYGDVWGFVPLGDFNYTWSQYARDWTEAFPTIGRVINSMENNMSHYAPTEEEAEQLLIKYGFRNLSKSADKRSAFWTFIRDTEGIKYSQLPQKFINAAAQHLVQGDDGTLMQALELGHEIAIHCPIAIMLNERLSKNYIFEKTYEHFLNKDVIETTIREERKVKGKSLAWGPDSHKYGRVATIYRACKDTCREFKDMDYVTMSPKFAKEHAVHMASVEEEPYHVITAIVGTNELYHADNPGEYYYHPRVNRPRKGIIVYRVDPDDLPETT